MKRILMLAAIALASAAPAAFAAEQHTDVYLHELASGGFHMIPEQMTANVGDTLVLTVHNQGLEKDNVLHDLVVCGDVASQPPTTCNDKWGATGAISNNVTAKLTVPVKAAGAYWYYCDLPGHAQAGMAGKLTVAGAATAPKTSPGTSVLGSLIALVGVALLVRKGRLK